MSDLPNEELVVQGLVDYITARFLQEFGKGKCSRGIPEQTEMAEECPRAWASQGTTSWVDCDNGYPLGVTKVGIGVRVVPEQSDQDAAEALGQHAVHTMINRAKWQLDQLILPVARTFGGVAGVRVHPDGDPNRYEGEGESWLFYPIALVFPSGLGDAATE